MEAFGDVVVIQKQDVDIKKNTFQKNKYKN